MKNKIQATLLFLISTLLAQANETMANTMRNNGKIYVVVAVILTILAGLIAYLIRIDRKINRLEKDKS